MVDFKNLGQYWQLMQMAAGLFMFLQANWPIAIAGIVLMLVVFGMLIIGLCSSDHKVAVAGAGGAANAGGGIVVMQVHPLVAFLRWIVEYFLFFLQFVLMYCVCRWLEQVWWIEHKQQVLELYEQVRFLLQSARNSKGDAAAPSAKAWWPPSAWFT